MQPPLRLPIITNSKINIGLLWEKNDCFIFLYPETISKLKRNTELYFSIHEVQTIVRLMGLNQQSETTYDIYKNYNFKIPVKKKENP